jgi:hypothetical protein
MEAFGKVRLNAVSDRWKQDSCGDLAITEETRDGRRGRPCAMKKAGADESHAGFA